MACDPNQLAQDAACISCIPAGIQDAIIISLLCQILTNGAGGIPAANGIQGVSYTVNPPPAPPNPALFAVAFDPTGNLSTQWWNIANQTWN